MGETDVIRDLTHQGISRTLTHLLAGYKLCRKYHDNYLLHLPHSINTMLPAYNFDRALTRRCLPRPECLIDVGANASQMARLLVLGCASNVFVHSFEPNPHTTCMGTRHMVALMSETKNITLTVPNGDSLCGMTVGGINWGKKTQTMPVWGWRFDEYVDAGKMPMPLCSGPVCMKIDTEGAELEVLKGCGPYLGCIDYLIVEMQNRVRSGAPPYSQFQLLRHLVKYGFNEMEILFSSWEDTESPSASEVLFWRDNAQEHKP